MRPAAIDLVFVSTTGPTARYEVYARRLPRSKLGVLAYWPALGEFVFEGSAVLDAGALADLAESCRRLTRDVSHGTLSRVEKLGRAK